MADNIGKISETLYTNIFFPTLTTGNNYIINFYIPLDVAYGRHRYLYVFYSFYLGVIDIYITSSRYFNEDIREVYIPAFSTYIELEDKNNFGSVITTIHDYISGGFKSHVNNPTTSNLYVNSAVIESNKNEVNISFRGDRDHMCLAFLATID